MSIKHIFRQWSWQASDPSTARGSNASNPVSASSDKPDNSIELTESGSVPRKDVEANISSRDTIPTENGDQGCGRSHIVYKNMDWWRVGMLMIAETISLGIFSLAYVLKVLGLIPGLIVITGFGVLSLYAGHTYGQFAIANVDVKNIFDAGKVIAGPWGGYSVGVGSVLVLLFVSAAHITSWSIAVNSIGHHTACTILWGLIGTAISFAGCVLRKLSCIATLSIVSCVSILAAITTVMIGIGIEKPNAGHITLVGHPTRTEAVVAILQVVLAYAGHVAYFGFIHEMKHKHDFTKALALMQAVSMSIYIIAAVVIYYYAGNLVRTPALNSVGSVAAKVGWILALPSIIIAGVVNGHVAIKQIYFGLWAALGKPTVIDENSLRAVWSWQALNAIWWLLAWVIAEAIPSFHLILSLVSCLFMGFFSYGFGSILWFKMNWRCEKEHWMSRKRASLLAVNVCMLTVGILINTVGLWATIEKLKSGAGGAVWSCADNSLPSMQGD